MLGHLFSLIPLGTIPFRVNALSVVCDTLTVGIVYFTALRLTHVRVAAMAAALVLAANPTFWAWSLEAEVFPLNNLLISLLVYLLVWWYQEPNRSSCLIAAAFVAGLALSNHQTSVLLAPAICLLLWNQRLVLFRRPGLVFICAVAIAAGFLPYLYVPWAARHDAFFNWGNVSSLHDLFALIARRSYGTTHLTTTGASFAGSFAHRIYALFRSFGLVMGVLVVLGLFRAYREQRWYFWFSVIGFGAIGIFFITIANIDVNKEAFGFYVLERFFISSQVLLAPAVALGILIVAEWRVTQRFSRPSSMVWAVSVVTLLAVVAGVIVNYRKIDQSRNHLARTYAEDVFATLPLKVILLVNGDENVLPLAYLYAVEQQRSDVEIVILPFLRATWYLRQLHRGYSDLLVPFDSYDGSQNNLKMLVEANPGRNFIAIGSVPSFDNSLTGHYWFYRRGLVNVVEPQTEHISVDQAANDNEQLLSQYRLPDWATIKPRSFESNLLLYYALPAAQLGHDYQRIGNYVDAEKWYRRALKIKPDFSAVQDALTEIDLAK